MDPTSSQAAPAPTPTSTPWLRRNRLWLALLVPLLLLALATSSFRLTRLYLPWQWSRPIVAHGTSGTFTHEFLGFDDVRHTRTVDVTVTEVSEALSWEGDAAVEGARLWRVGLLFAAAPDQLLRGCTIELTDADGVRYRFEGGRQSAGTDKLWSPAAKPDCVPEDTPGPDIAPFTGRFERAEVERPASWYVSTSMVLPLGVTPTHVRVMWTEPEYLVLDVPR